MQWTVVSAGKTMPTGPAQDPTQRWASRCSAAGIGYMAELRQDCANPKPDRTSSASEAQAAAEAIQSCLWWSRSLYESTFETAARAICPGCGRCKRWYCNRCLQWLPLGSPCPLPPRRLHLPFQLEIIVRDDVDSATQHSPSCATQSLAGRHCV